MKLQKKIYQDKPICNIDSVLVEWFDHSDTDFYTNFFRNAMNL